ncbi:hypothetical protein WR25_03743 [Diploscapter pachys]|uniref:SCP2 domain-containing protein n=1 Tax=Diploscapter pachys TaxID=2018661 RepID=A0A2A2LNA2_9BILA|nr:hypothetical protein WR25_03743 [Diploscapter pachys]
MTFKSDVVFDEIKERINTEKELAKKVSTAFRITVTASDGTVKKWTVDTKSDPAYVGDEDREVEVEINIKDEDFMKIAQGKMKPDQAFMQGKMKLKGNITKAMKLKTILDPSMLKSKL